MIITPVTPEHYDILVEWYKSFWGEYYPERTKSDWIDYIGKNSVVAPITLIAIDIQGSKLIPVGTTSIRLNDMDGYDKRTAWLLGVYVVPEYRNKGIATNIIQEIIRIADTVYDQIYLFTRTDGQLYKKLGWEIIDESIISEIPTLIMNKKLSPLSPIPYSSL